ncbi:hypothetical protein AGMMS49574_06410 [Bacteroidia bacterium]|nr:hypothetical protein AGMMS49574_06410 [Bacteroidia bacterium]GHU54765.1 hypothetical protein FACS189411_01990 [Bacteroidia bacterium]
MSEKEKQQYDEEDSVKYIQNFLPQELKERFSNDDILYLLDLVNDFYDTKGDVEPTDEEYEQYDEEMIQYIIKNAKDDGVGVYTAEEIAFILDGEVEYCDSIAIFE